MRASLVIDCSSVLTHITTNFSYKSGCQVPDFITSNGGKATFWAREGMFHREFGTTSTVDYLNALELGCRHYISYGSGQLVITWQILHVLKMFCLEVGSLPIHIAATVHQGLYMNVKILQALT